jgi:hypothetical protein
VRKRNVVLTGLPRGGTTLTCRLLNQLPDTVALHEPIAPGRFVGAEDDQAVLEGVERFFRRTRRMIRREKVAVSKHVGGKSAIWDEWIKASTGRPGCQSGPLSSAETAV